MDYKKSLKKVGKYAYELPKTGEMEVSGKLFISEKLLKLVEENSLKQIANVAKLPGIIKHSFGMPDIHSGYGYSIGGVAAFDLDEGVISPGGVGYDIDCSVRLLKTNLKVSDIKDRKELIHSLSRAVPSGVGRGSSFQLTYKELDGVLEEGAEWVVKKLGEGKEDLKHLEDGGKLIPCRASDVSDRAKKRGIGQLGTLGAGNHFLEIQEVEEIYDKEFAKKWEIEKGQVMIMIHCGSRGLGHQVASDYIRSMEDKYGFPEFDRELVNAPIKSELGKKYLSAMNCAANFAFANKQVITHNIRENLKHYFPKIEIQTIYEVCHNIAKIEEHFVGGAPLGVPQSAEFRGKKKKVLVTRKGATRSFPNQPVIIPGSMGTSSYLLVGTEKAMELSFGSTAHGAGRVMSRHEAIRRQKGEDVKKKLNKLGIEVESGSIRGLSEEAPEAYKDIDEVIEVSDKLGLAKKVARLKPLAVIKG
jgi:tRNA-splicing ligase RtcB (3'-phosphate/5'-hydroxy nucleic acid ligase)